MMLIFKNKEMPKNGAYFNDFTEVDSLFYKEGSPAKIKFIQGNEINAVCLNCKFAKCMNYSNSEVHLDDIENFPQELNKSVCPVNAIKISDKGILEITTDCIGCGVCAHRCPVGAIYVKNHKFTVNTSSCSVSRFIYNDASLQIQEEQLQCLINAKKDGAIIDNLNKHIDFFYSAISKQECRNLFIRNIMISLGIPTSATRKGDVYSRMDLIMKTEDSFSAIEIEFGTDALSVSRCLLDDIATLSSRYNISKDKHIPLAIFLYLPNKRQGYWQVIKDINVVLGLKINTITIGALLILMWNFKTLTLNDFYLDSDNMSIYNNFKDILTEFSMTDFMPNIFEPLK